MKKLILLLPLVLFVLTPQVLASTDTSIDVSNNGEGAKTDVSVTSNTGNNTICQNGKCTTTNNNGESKTTVCIEGKCETTDGNVDIQEGNTKIKVTTNSDETDPTVTPEATVTQEPTKPATDEAKTDQKAEGNHFDLGVMLRNFGKFLVELFI
jgi:hypothetical protein